MSQKMSEREAVLDANRSFYRAFESLDIEQMTGVWVQAPHIVCIHPGWRKLTGWGPIMASWEGIFQSAFEMKFEIEENEVIIGGDLAAVVVLENLTQRGHEGTLSTQVLATNLFERRGEKWLMVLHHGSPIFQRQGGEPTLQ